MKTMAAKAVASALREAKSSSNALSKRSRHRVPKRSEADHGTHGRLALAPEPRVSHTGNHAATWLADPIAACDWRESVRGSV
jgi:hypothetical protein